MADFCRNLLMFLIVKPVDNLLLNSGLAEPRYFLLFPLKIALILFFLLESVLKVFWNLLSRFFFWQDVTTTHSEAPFPCERSFNVHCMTFILHQSSRVYLTSCTFRSILFLISGSVLKFRIWMRSTLWTCDSEPEWKKIRWTTKNVPCDKRKWGWS